MSFTFDLHIKNVVCKKIGLNSVEGIQPHWINRMCSRMLHHKLQSYLNVYKWFIIIINVNYNLHH